ncbi:MAG: LytTR family DNA-binding domain-containing protein [Cellvibrionales bacterium]|nr:LytTR family DNA-binding domain-containing protein [Cellvibrionales bacterium]
MTEAIALLVVDDEPLARSRLIRLLQGLGYTAIAEASSAKEARSLCQASSYAVLFLDVRMPEEDGLSLAKSLQTITNPPKIIFTTAYDEYALPAFDVFAAGFLLKPIDKHRLAKVLERTLETLDTTLPIKEKPRLRCQMKGATVFLPVDAVRVLQAEDKYVVVHSTQGVGLTEKSLKQLDEGFTEDLIRIHRNALVNKAKISGLKKVGNETQALITDCNLTPTISRRFLPVVKKLLQAV